MRNIRERNLLAVHCKMGKFPSLTSPCLHRYDSQMSSITPIGMTDWRDQHQVFGIKQHDRFGHIYCIGKTGVGKSTLLLNLAISDIEQGRGICTIDPHGDLSETILNHVPKERIEDVIYFNAGDSEYPIAFNPLAGIKDEERYLTVATIVIALKKLWSDAWGPRLEHILRNTLLSLSYYSKSSLLDIVPMLTNNSFRKQVLYAVPESTLHDFWKKEFEPLSPQLRNEFISPVINKVGLFASHPIIRNIIGQNRSAFTITEVMNTNKILIVNLSKGVLGEAGSQLLGSLLVTQFQTASLQRATIPIDKRNPFFLYIDEMASFVTKSFCDILSESRKYSLGLYLTHQFLDQLPEDMQNSILGNVGTVVCFRLGSRDAKRMAEEFFPVFTQTDLLNLPRYHIYLKLLIEGTISKPFSAITLPVNKPTCSHQKEIITFSQTSYGTAKAVIEETIRNSKTNEVEERTLFS